MGHRRRPGWSALALLLAGVAVSPYLARERDRQSGDTAVVVAPHVAEVMRVDLQRLEAERPRVQLGRRNIFITPAPPLTIAPREDPADTAPRPSLVPPPSPPPASIPLKFMGIVSVTDGPRVAVFLTEQKEILHGRVGETLAGRYKIVNLERESVDVQEIVLGHQQTIRIGGR